MFHVSRFTFHAPRFTLGSFHDVSYRLAMRAFAFPNLTPAFSHLRSSLSAAVAFVYPEVCEICGVERTTPAEGFVCAGGGERVGFINPPFCGRCGLPYHGQITGPFECANCSEMESHFRSARSAVTTGGPVLEAIHRYKYQRALWFEPFLADLLI